MTRIIRRKRSIKLLRFSTSLFVVLFVCFLGSATMLKSYNVSLSVNKQKLEQDIKQFSEKKETLQLQVSELSSRPRIMAIAEAEGLEKNQANIVSVAGSASNGE